MNDALIDLKGFALQKAAVLFHSKQARVHVSSSRLPSRIVTTSKATVTRTASAENVANSGIVLDLSRLLRSVRYVYAVWVNSS
jgi:hypothetical protein